MTFCATKWLNFFCSASKPCPKNLNSFDYSLWLDIEIRAIISKQVIILLLEQIFPFLLHNNHSNRNNIPKGEWHHKWVHHKVDDVSKSKWKAWLHALYVMKIMELGRKNCNPFWAFEIVHQCWGAINKSDTSWHWKMPLKGCFM